MLDELEIGVEHAEAIVKKGIELGVHSDGVMPDTKKGKIEAAHDIITLAVDSYVEDGIRPDAEGEDEEETKSMRSTAKDILELFELAGIKAKKKGKKYTGDISYGTPPELEEEEEDEEDEIEEDEEGDDVSDDETPFDPESLIKGYWELTPATRIKKIKALKLDPEDDDDYNTLVGFAEAEEAADKPASRVLNYLEELVPAEDVEEEDEEDEEIEEEEDEDAEDEEEDDEEDEDEEEDEEEDDDETDDDAGDDDEPYTADELEELDKDDLREIYDDLELDEDDFPKRWTDKGKARVIEAIIAAQGGEAEDDDEEEIEEPIEDYETLKEAQIKATLQEQLEDEDDPLTEEQLEYVIEYEKGREKSRKRLVTWLENFLEEAFGDEADDEDDDEEEEVEEKPAKKSKGTKSKGGSLTNVDGISITITREQILEALESGKVVID